MLRRGKPPPELPDGVQLNQCGARAFPAGGAFAATDFAFPAGGAFAATDFAFPAGDVFPDCAFSANCASGRWGARTERERQQDV